MLPGTPALRREQIKLQVAIITPLIHVKGFAAPETEAAAAQARLLMEQAEALGESLEDPLLPFYLLYGAWAPAAAAFNGDVCRDLAAQFLALAEKQEALMIGHGHLLLGMSLLWRGDIAESRAHHNQAIALYDPAEHLSIATRFGADTRVSNSKLAIVGPMAPRLSRGRARRYRQRAQVGARDWPSRVADGCAGHRKFQPYLLRKLRGSKRGIK